MKVKIVVFASLFLIASAFTLKTDGLKYLTKNGKVSFFSTTGLEDIAAENNKVSSILDSKSGKIVIEVLINSFRFKKALMEEHFNENYMESTKFPKAKFDGKIDNLSEVNFSKDGTYKTMVSGNLTIKDKTNAVKTTSTLTVKGGKLNGKTKFKILLADYNVVIPSVVKDKIDKEMEISADLDYEPMK
jgi:hypothetical protein